MEAEQKLISVKVQHEALKKQHDAARQQLQLLKVQLGN